MALKVNSLSENKLPAPVIEAPSTDLTKEEIQYLLSKIRDITFKGTELEIITQVVLKLQDQYTKLEESKG